MVELVGFVLAALVWVGVFRPDDTGIWRRVSLGAALLVTGSVGLLAIDGRLGEAVGDLTLGFVGWGALVGATTVVATHVAYRLVVRLVPSLADELDDLYRLRAGHDPRLLVPIAAMGIGEELLFRGLVQHGSGLGLAVAAYTTVQIVTGRWPLLVAAAVMGAIWGALYWWTGGIAAPVVAHVTWSATLASVWPLPTADVPPRSTALAPTAHTTR